MDYLRYIVDELHSVVFATVDGEGRPVTCAIDIMDSDETGLYFLTVRGKKFYERLKAEGNIAFTAVKGRDTLSSVAVSVQGKARQRSWGAHRVRLRRRERAARRLLRDGQVHRLQAVLLQVSAAVHRHHAQARSDSAGTLPALRQLL